MAIKVILRYDDTTKMVVGSYVFSSSTHPTQPTITGTSLEVYTIDGDTTEGESSDLMTAKNMNGPHEVVSSAINRQEFLLPDALTAQSGFTPSPTVACFAGADMMATATDNDTNTSCHVTFPTPGDDPMTGADRQTITVMASQFDTGQTGTPTVRIEVWENGGGSALVASSEINVTGENQMVSFTWNATSLGTADGSVVEAKVFGTKSGGGEPVKNAVNIGTITWKAWRATNWT